MADSPHAGGEHPPDDGPAPRSGSRAAGPWLVAEPDPDSETVTFVPRAIQENATVTTAWLTADADDVIDVRARR